MSRTLTTTPSERERFKWLLAWMRLCGQADILNSQLVDEYAEATGATLKPRMFGAFECRRLAQDLSRMAFFGYADRRTTGIGDGLCHQGFPKWVWSYRPGRYAHTLETS